MKQGWGIKLYRNPNGEFPVQKFIDSLEIKAQAKVRDSVVLLREFGITVSSHHTKKLTGTDLWEIRILGSDSIRIIYVAIVQKTFLLLHGFKKKSKKTPPKEIKIAERRLEEYRKRTK